MLRGAKLGTADDALHLAMDFQCFREIENNNAQTAKTVNKVCPKQSQQRPLYLFVHWKWNINQSSTFRPNKEFHQRGDTSSAYRNDHSQSQSNGNNLKSQLVRFQSSQGRERPITTSRSNTTQTTEYLKKDTIIQVHLVQINHVTIPTIKITESHASINILNNHTSKKYKPCFSCLRVGHDQRKCKASKGSI